MRYLKIPATEGNFQLIRLSVIQYSRHGWNGHLKFSVKFEHRYLVVLGGVLKTCPSFSAVVKTFEPSTRWFGSLGCPFEVGLPFSLEHSNPCWHMMFQVMLLMSNWNSCSMEWCFSMSIFITKWNSTLLVASFVMKRLLRCKWNWFLVTILIVKRNELTEQFPCTKPLHRN